MRKKYLRERYPDTSSSDAESHWVCKRVVGQQERHSKRRILKTHYLLRPEQQVE